MSRVRNNPTGKVVIESILVLSVVVTPPPFRCSKIETAGYENKKWISCNNITYDLFKVK